MGWLADSELEDALNAITYHEIEGSSIQRPVQAFQMLQSLGGIALETARMHEIIDAKKWRMIEDRQISTQNHEFQRLANESFALQCRHEALIRGLYELAHFALRIVSADAAQRENLFEHPLRSFANNNSALFELIDESAARQAYVVSTYRSKVLAHHASRVQAYAWQMDADGAGRIVAMGSSLKFEFDDADLVEVERLWAAYSMLTAAPEQQSIIERVHQLFLNIPVLGDGRLSADRKEIDDLVGKYGAKSHSLDELLLIPKTFAIELRKVIASSKAG